MSCCSDNTRSLTAAWNSSVHVSYVVLRGLEKGMVGWQVLRGRAKLGSKSDAYKVKRFRAT